MSYLYIELLTQLSYLIYLGFLNSIIYVSLIGPALGIMGLWQYKKMKLSILKKKKSLKNYFTYGFCYKFTN